MSEYKFDLVIVPESYDYGEEEIVYRIYFDNQLISERSLPILGENQGIVDTFYINFETFKKIFLRFVNLKEKKCVVKNFKINDISFNATNTVNINIKGLNLNFVYS